jgi:plastocyanin
MWCVRVGGHWRMGALLATLAALGGCGGLAGRSATPPTISTSTSTKPAPPPPGAVIIRISEGQAWQPTSVSIAPTQAVLWENDDTMSGHPIECVQSDSSTACPWQGALALPAAQRDASGVVHPSWTQVIFLNGGSYTFRDALHTALIGKVVVGAPGRPPSPTATP